MTNAEIIALAHEAGIDSDLIDEDEGQIFYVSTDTLHRFATLVSDRMFQNGYRKCAEGQGETQFCSQLESAVAGVRERDTALLRQALEALHWLTTADEIEEPPINKTIAALRERLGEKE